MFVDYRFDWGMMFVMCGNSSAISISKYLIIHYCTKHIEIQHHFIRDLVGKNVIYLEYIPLKGQLA